MAVNYRQILNRVLVALSEEEIPTSQASIDTAYHRLLGLFVNQIKEEVEDAHNWRALRSTQSVTVLANTSSIAITNANERSRVLREYNDYWGSELALVFDVTDASNPYRLIEMDMSELLRREALNTSTTNSQPTYFAMDSTGADALAIRVYPQPSSNRNIDVTLIIPQAEFTDDDLDVSISIPARVVSMGATWQAYEERGEELGVNGMFNAERFDGVLGEAIALDAAEQGEYQLVPT